MENHTAVPEAVARAIDEAARSRIIVVTTPPEIANGFYKARAHFAGDEANGVMRMAFDLLAAVHDAVDAFAEKCKSGSSVH